MHNNEIVVEDKDSNLKTYKYTNIYTCVWYAYMNQRSNQGIQHRKNALNVWHGMARRRMSSNTQATITNATSE